MILKVCRIPFIIFLWLAGAFSLSAQVTQLEIWEIQGNGITGPYLGQTVHTGFNVVTAVGNDRFFIQTPTSRTDGDPATSDGMIIFTDSPPPFEPGDVVSITGQVIESQGMTTFSSQGITIVQEPTEEELPPPVELNETFPGPTPGTVPDLEKVEGMRVQFTATVCGPTDDSENAAIHTSAQRPFREPGIPYPGLASLPVWDGNPELFWFDPNGLNAPNNRFFNTGMTITATAVIRQRQERYFALPTSYTFTGNALLQGVRQRNANEVTIGSVNVLQLFPDAFDYNKRLKKVARYIVELMDAPDILALQEVGDINALEDLLYYIELNDPDINYSPYLLQGFGDINVGYLLRPTVQEVSVGQLGNNQFLSLGGQLHDRPPLLLEAVVATQPPTPIKVLNLHLRSLLGIEGENATFVRTKRYEQAVSVATMIQQMQEDDLVIVGDFNAYPFTDGYVDVFNQIVGSPTLGAQYPLEDIIDPPLVDHAESLPPHERYSYVFEGNAQQIDHCLSTQLTGFLANGMQFARGNADNALAYGDNEFILPRASDHDGFVLFLEPLSPLAAAEEKPASAAPVLSFPNPFRAGIDEISVNNDLSPATLQLFDFSGKMVWSQNFSGPASYFSLPGGLPKGVYALKLTSEGRAQAWKIILF